MKISLSKILSASVMIIFFTSSVPVIAVGTTSITHSSDEGIKSLTTDSLPYKGRLIIYVVEPLSRWNMYNQQPYHFGSLGTATDTVLSIDYLSSYNHTYTWYGDASEDNIIVMAAVFNPDIYQGFADPPSGNAFDAHYVDAAAAATPGNIGYNYKNATYTHTVFIEEATRTDCKYCPIMAGALYNISRTGDFPFYYVALIGDENPDASDRLENDYNTISYPAGFFDGGYRVLVGGDSNNNSYTSRIQACGKRSVHDLNVSLTVQYIGSGDLQIQVNITNNQTVHVPETPSMPNGPTSGHAGIKYTFMANTTDEDGGDLFYMFDWGDGTKSDWVGPKTSGLTGTSSHIWTSAGDLQIKVKAKDRSGHETAWSNPFTTHMAPPVFLFTITGGIGKVTAVITNNINETIPQVHWTFSVVGGILKRINTSDAGSSENLGAGENFTASINKTLFGLGRIKVTVTAETTIYEVNGFIIGPFIIMKRGS